MALKTFKPYTKSTRGTILTSKEGLWKGKPFKPLTSANYASKGRNNYGRITSRIMVEVTNINIAKLISIERKMI